MKNCHVLKLKAKDKLEEDLNEKEVTKYNKLNYNLLKIKQNNNKQVK